MAISATTTTRPTRLAFTGENIGLFLASGTDGAPPAQPNRSAVCLATPEFCRPTFGRFETEAEKALYSPKRFTQKSGFVILPVSNSMSDSLVVCLECDALHQRRALAAGEAARCIRCGAVLYRHPWLSREQVLALVVTALLTFVIANSYPIVNLTVQGIDNSATLFGSILALWNEGRMLVAVLVFATTLLFPLIDLVALLILLVLVRRRHPPPLFAPLLRFVQALRPWGMTEVFMLGVVVALVKLSHMAHILPGVALWAFGALTLLLAAIVSFDLRSLWHGVGRSDPS